MASVFTSDPSRELWRRAIFHRLSFCSLGVGTDTGLIRLSHSPETSC